VRSITSTRASFAAFPKKPDPLISTIDDACASGLPSRSVAPSDATIPPEYILLNHFLDDLEPVLEARVPQRDTPPKDLLIIEINDCSSGPETMLQTH
jgi:hypothetical protein